MKTLIASIAIVCIWLFLTMSCFSQQDAAKTRGQEWKKELTINVNKNNPYEQVLFYTKKYAKEYNIPEGYLFNILKVETGFHVGDTTYNPFSRYILRTRWDGPFQMLASTAKLAWPDTLNNLTKAEFKHKMRFDLEFSIHTGVKYVHMLYVKYKNWGTVFSVYNIGPGGEHKINKYSKRITKI